MKEQWPPMETAIIQTVEANQDQMLKTIKKITSIRSDHQPEVPGAPFGVGINEALEATLAEAEGLGFKTKNLSGYFGYASYGTGDSYVGVMGHLDTVPAGEGWRSDPFTCVEREGRLYARGILDNKGPILTCLYALYALKQLHWQPKREIRILFGTAEEIGFQDIPHYLAVEEPPKLGFTPDCKYPVVYAERGRLVVQIACQTDEQLLELLNQYILNTQGLGETLNLRYHDEEFGDLETRNYQIKRENGEYHLTFAISYPARLTAQDLIERVKQALPTSYTVTSCSNWDPVYFDKESLVIQTLSEVYGKLTGLPSQPVTTTGGTYAKVMPNIFPFGPSFPGQKGISHHPDEWMAIDDLMMNAKIYALALYHLGNFMEEDEE
ncbi:MAG: Sapep family Mn(2+)-dependent dipeptidase [Aerococcus sp.]|nr:Sapep family Mn(2+)-dependent dipeptidase [Aerococcus sp.]